MCFSASRTMSATWSLGPPYGGRRFRDRPVRPLRHFPTAAETDFFTRGTEGSNPACSSGESRANLTRVVFTMQHFDPTTDEKRSSSHGGPRVRIPLPPAESQSLGRIRVRGSRTPAFRAGVGGWLGDAVGRDAQGFPIRANLRQYLCRAIFQYRSAADVVGENATPIPTKSGLPRFNVRQIFEFGSGSGKAEHGALIVPSERQT